MSDKRPSSLPLVLMVLWFALLLLGTGSIFLIGLMFGSEVYRGDSIPVTEWIMIAGPFLLNIGLLLLTIYFWNSGRQNLSFAVTGVSMLAVVAFMALSSGAFI